MIFEIIGRRSNTKQHLIDGGWMTLIIGACFAMISVITGFLVESSVLITKEASFFAGLHKFVSLGMAVFVVIVICFRLLLVKKLDDKEYGAAIRGSYLTLQVITICLVLSASVVGTTLVHRYGVGVAPYQDMQKLPVTPPVQNGISVDTTEFRN